MNVDFLLEIAASALRQNCSESRILGKVKSLNIKVTDNLKDISRDRIIVSTVSMELETFNNLSEYVDYINDFVKKAANDGAQLICFPELCGLLPLSLIPMFEKIVSGISGKGKKDKGRMPSSIDLPSNKGIKSILTAVYDIHMCLFRELSKAYGIYIMSGSFFVYDNDGIYNRAHLFDENGTIIGFQDKAQLVPFEKELGIKTSDDIKVFDTRLGKIAFPVCMDATYYETFKIARSKGAQIVIVPAANMENYNYYLSLRGIEPRVQESRVYGIKSALVGGERIGLDFTGLSGVFAPAELTDKKDGIIAVSRHPRESEVVTAALNLDALGNLKNDYRDDINTDFLQNELENAYTNFFEVMKNK